MKNGDIVLVNWYWDDYKGDDKELLLVPAMLIRILNDNRYLVTYYSNNSYNIIVVKNIAPIEDIEIHRTRLSDYYDEKINTYKSKIRYVTNEDKDKEKVKKYEDVKHRLLNNCIRLLESVDDDELLNRAKEINNLKGQMQNVEFECAGEIRRENGSIKYHIRELNSKKNIALGKISDDAIERNFGRFLK